MALDWVRSDIDFAWHGSRCAGWLYLPRAVVRPPLVIMAHGFGAERTFGLEPFAERFARAGLATFLFDYRCFGDSDGEPRNLISPRRQLEDWEAAAIATRHGWRRTIRMMRSSVPKPRPHSAALTCWSESPRDWAPATFSVFTGLTGLVQIGRNDAESDWRNNRAFSVADQILESPIGDQ